MSQVREVKRKIKDKVNYKVTKIFGMPELHQPRHLDIPPISDRRVGGSRGPNPVLQVALLGIIHQSGFYTFSPLHRMTILIHPSIMNCPKEQRITTQPTYGHAQHTSQTTQSIQIQCPFRRFSSSAKRFTPNLR